MKVTIIQQLLPNYRIDVFNALQSSLQKERYVLQLLSTDTVTRSVNFENKKFRATKRKGIWFTEKLSPYLIDSKVIIVMWDIHWLSLMALLIVKSPGQKIILWGHGISNSDNILAKLPRKITGWLADALLFYDPLRKKIFCNDSSKLLKKSFVANNTIMVPNHGVDKQNKHTFLYVGRINKYKQVDQLIYAYQVYCNQTNSPCRLTIVGDGDLLNEIKLLAVELHVSEYIDFVGAVYEDKLLKEYFDSAICYVNPGTIGLGIVHAFAYGVPAIVCRDRKHGPEYTYCNKNNSIIYTGDHYALAEKIIFADKNREVMEEMSDQAYSFFIHELKVEVMLAGMKQAIEYVYTNN